MRRPAEHPWRTWRLKPVVILIGMCILAWAASVQAVDVVRKSDRRVNGASPPTAKEKTAAPADTTGLTRGLLDNVRSQREKGTASDTLDTWIDRDGDGVNDRLKKSAAPEKSTARGLMPAAKPKKAEPTKPADTTKKGNAKSRAEPQKKRRH